MVSNVIKDTYDIIHEELGTIYLTTPSSQEDSLKIANDFEKLWNFPNVIGALDGKHVHIQYPAGTGKKFHNYKEFFNFVLLAACDARYCFTLTDIGEYGSNNDSGLFKKSELAK